MLYLLWTCSSDSPSGANEEPACTLAISEPMLAQETGLQLQVQIFIGWSVVAVLVALGLIQVLVSLTQVLLASC